MTDIKDTRTPTLQGALKVLNAAIDEASRGLAATLWESYDRPPNSSIKFFINMFNWTTSRAPPKT